MDGWILTEGLQASCLGHKPGCRVPAHGVWGLHVSQEGHPVLAVWALRVCGSTNRPDFHFQGAGAPVLMCGDLPIMALLAPNPSGVQLFHFGTSPFLLVSLCSGVGGAALSRGAAVLRAGPVESRAHLPLCSGLAEPCATLKALGPLWRVLKSGPRPQGPRGQQPGFREPAGASPGSSVGVCGVCGAGGGEEGWMVAPAGPPGSPWMVPVTPCGGSGEGAAPLDGTQLRGPRKTTSSPFTFSGELRKPSAPLVSPRSCWERPPHWVPRARTWVPTSG